MLAKTTKAIHAVLWPVENVQAFTTTRHPPFTSTTLKKKLTTTDHYDAFNLGIHVGDNLLQVKQNRQSLLAILPERSQIQWLNQVHGCHVHYLNQYSPVAIEADAIITQCKHVALAIMTADCLPILISDVQGNEIAAIHGGWRSLSSNVIAKTITKMKTSRDQLYIWLGPCIGKTVFEVGEEVRQAFVNQSTDFITAFAPIINSTNNVKTIKYLADLQAIAIIQLRQLGIINVSILPHCTYSMPDDYYSYRRENITGRMASIICRL
ncbi:MAG: peptidoglycan editing factor PgeF [Alteromonadaceae bacterium]|nr:peptidoglycan editing factor PgeF [Alteromonadaceae bacterium]